MEPGRCNQKWHGGGPQGEAIISLEALPPLKNPPEIGAAYSCSGAWAGLCRELYGYDLRAFTIKRESAVIGGFFCAIVRSGLFGTRLISMPFSDESGLWLKPGLTLAPAEAAELRDSLVLKLDALAADAGADYAELRGPDLLFQEGTGDKRFTVAAPYLRLVLDTSLPYETLRGNFHINLIKNLRKADKLVTVRETREPEEFGAVYGIYLRQMRLFGSPPLPAEHFQRLLEAGLGRLFIASVENKPAALLFAIERDGTFFADVNAGLPEFENFFPKIKLFNETIRLACREGLRRYDFMRTRPGSGVHEHKKKWGGKELPIRYYFRVYKEGKKPGLDPEQAGFALPRLLLKFAPLRLLEAAGPFLRRHAGK